MVNVFYLHFQALVKEFLYLIQL